MEDLLLNIVKDAQGTKLATLKQAAQIAHGNSNHFNPHTPNKNNNIFR